MSPASHLQGLNLVYSPEQPSSDAASASGSSSSNSNAFLSDSLDLLSVPPDLTAQLDLWTHLAFQSDEGQQSLASAGLSDSGSGSPVLKLAGDFLKKYAAEVEAEEDDGDEARGPATADSHQNVRTGTIVHDQEHNQSTNVAGFDLNTFLSTLSQMPAQGPTPSLAQVLSLYQQQATSPPSTTTATTSTSTASISSASSTSAGPSPPKRARTRKSSISASAVSPPEPSALDDDAFLDEASSPLAGGSLTPAEDKRRRNTAASARFRAKKKEREQALEKKAKDMETRVGELERECEALRRENGWLKGLVVGVTGAQGAAAVNVSLPAMPQGAKRPWEPEPATTVQ